MLKTAVVALKLCEDLPDIEADAIGADKGALVLAEKGIRMKQAIGDFDSVTPEEFALIAEYADEIVRLNTIKDDSDSESALAHAFEAGYETVWLCGGLGGRADHAYVNLQLLWKYPEKTFLYDGRNLITVMKEGRHEIRRGGYPYISFFTRREACISLEGMKYVLDHRTITEDDLYTLSNEITEETGILTVHSGMIMVMQTKD